MPFGLDSTVIRKGYVLDIRAGYYIEFLIFEKNITFIRKGSVLAIRARYSIY